MLSHISNYLNSKFYASVLDVFLLGMCITMASQTFVWNAGLPTHFYGFLTGMIIVAIMYTCLVLCVAEMMSALPFSGGIYGLARVALNPHLGFLVGILETFKNVIHIACSVGALAGFTSYSLHGTEEQLPLYWFVILGSGTVICILGGRFFWNFNRLLGLTCLAIIVMYLFTPIFNKTDFKKYGNTNFYYQPIHDYNTKDILSAYSIGCWSYMGIELLPFTCIDTKNATKDIPRALIATLATVIFLTFFIYVSACSQAPGSAYLGMANMPLMFGFADMLKMDLLDTAWLCLVCDYGSVFAFLFGCGRQIASLSSSGLLPSFLKWKTMYSETPFMALITTAILVYLTMITVQYRLRANVTSIFYICFLASYFSYFNVFVTYIQFKRKYMTLKREFTNPLGIYAAYLGILITLFLTACFLGLGSGEVRLTTPIIIIVLLFAATIYYFLFVAKTQYYSEEEQKAFLITYVINNNKRGRKKNMKKGSGFTLSTFLQKSDRSLSTTTRNFFTFISLNKYRSSNNIYGNKVTTPDDISMASKGTSVGGGVNKKDEDASDGESLPNGNQSTIDFAQLPSMEVLKHIHEDIELKQHPDQAQSIKTKEQHLDFLPHTPGLVFSSMKIVPTTSESTKNIELNHDIESQ